MNTPAVSVVMAAYNGAPLIGATLASLVAQRFTDFEVLVVDDCSTDATRDVVSAWSDRRVRLIALEANGGPVRARNRGVAEARGRYVAALDQDDLCRPDRFARQVAYLDAHPEVALLGTAAEMLAEDGRIGAGGHAPTTTPMLTAWLSWIENPLVWSSVMIRTDAARRFDVFTRPEILYAEDFDLYHRIQRHGAIARLDEALLLYRQHGGGASQRYVATMRESATRVLAEAHADVLGTRAERIARALVLHNMGRLPVPDRATLRLLGDGIGTLQAAFLAGHAVTPQDARLIRWETARRWGRIGAISLRAGTVSLRDLIAVRPDHLGLGYAGIDAILWSGMVGATRRTRQTLAEKIIRPGPSSANT